MPVKNMGDGTLMGDWDELKVNDSITIYCHLDDENGIAIEKNGAEVAEFTKEEAKKIMKFLIKHYGGK